MRSYNNHAIGDWPSGKATGSGPVIRGSNPLSPAKKLFDLRLQVFFIKMITNDIIICMNIKRAPAVSQRPCFQDNGNTQRC